MRSKFLAKIVFLGGLSRFNIGSYGIKGAIVNTVLGEIISKKKTTGELDDTRPHKLISKMHDIVKQFDWDGPIGCAFPAAMNRGIVISANRIDEAWVDADADHLFSEITSCPVNVINDTDATGLAEMTFGVGKNQKGTTIFDGMKIALRMLNIKFNK